MHEDNTGNHPDRGMSTAELERLFTHDQGDPGIRRELGWALCRDAFDACSVTRDQARVITSARQREVCDRAARRILDLETGDRGLIEKAAGMLDEIRAGDRWHWHPRASAAVLLAVTVLGGLTAVSFAAMAELPGVAALAALIASLLLAVVVVRYRREHWRTRAERLRPTVWRQGV
ncbi:hypothetical protein GCM10027199_06370 [Amycolatopsis magusensis]